MVVVVTKHNNIKSITVRLGVNQTGDERYVYRLVMHIAQFNVQA